MTASGAGERGRVVIYGAGGLGREVLQLLRTIGGYEILGFVDDGIEPGSVRNDAAILGNIDCLEALREPFSLVFGMASPAAKQKTHAALRTNPLISFPTVIHPSASISEYAQVQEGVVINASCFVSVDATLGVCVLLNNGTMVAHDAAVGDFTSVMPMSAISGAVTIGQCCTIGTQTAIHQGISIGSNCTVGMGSIVLADVPDGATVLGNPAKIVRRA